jgi:RimJ/RimL family protein N-acetyltransferase
MEITTARLLLREFTDGDLPALTAYQADPRYFEFWPDEERRDDTGGLLATFRRWADERPRRNFQLAVAQLQTRDEVIGSCGLRRMPDAGIAEFGIELAPRCWGFGYATEAAQAMLSFGFDELGLREIRGVSVTENARVTTMASRLGFTRRGTSPGPAWLEARGWSRTEWYVTRSRRCP